MRLLCTTWTDKNVTCVAGTFRSCFLSMQYVQSCTAGEIRSAWTAFYANMRLCAYLRCKVLNCCLEVPLSGLQPADVCRSPTADQLQTESMVKMTIQCMRGAQGVIQHSHSSPCLHMQRHIVSCRVQGCWHQQKVGQQSMYMQLSANQSNRQPPTDSQENQETTIQQADRSLQQSKPVWVQQLQTKWDTLDTAQQAYAVGVCVLALAAAPKLLTLLVIGLERVFIGGLLAIEEALLGVLFKGGAVLGLVAVLGVLLFGIYLFVVPKTTK